MHPKPSLEIAAERLSWGRLDWHAGEADVPLQALRRAVLKRDKQTCAFCGFKSQKFQEVHHLDHDHENTDLANLVTACPFCHLCFHLGLAGIKKAGTVVWCPESDQATLNNLARSIFVAVAAGGRREDAARSLYNSLESRAVVTEEHLGTGASDPARLGQGMLAISVDARATLAERLHGFRLLPRMPAFPKQVQFWLAEEARLGASSNKTSPAAA